VSAGWLPTDASTLDVLEGFRIDRAKFPTRYEEYKFVRDTLAKVPPGVVLDAGSGFNPEIHVMPWILESIGWKVMAIDSNLDSLKMPGTVNTVRHVDDMRFLQRWQGSELDAWVSVSTLEHLEPLWDSIFMALQAAYGCLRHGGVAVLTADMLAPARLNGMLASAGFEIGEVVPFTGTMLTPSVAWAVARKP
jgi:hypothetical protein